MGNHKVPMGEDEETTGRPLKKSNEQHGVKRMRQQGFISHDKQQFQPAFSL
jgi:hypothetical protein